MEFRSAKERIELANFMLKEIEKKYQSPKKVFELYTEYFLILCKSTIDYVIFDYLDSLEPKMKMSDKVITIRKRPSRRKDPSKIPHIKQKEISKFLQKHKEAIDDFEKEPLVRYFSTLRNLMMHSVFPNLFTQQYEKSGDKQKIVYRRFQEKLVDYLLLENGDYLLKEDGFRILLESSGEDSILDISPLSDLSTTEKESLRILLRDDEPLELMIQYLDKIKKFVEKFEKM